jgi:hypothetical protein
MRSSKVKFSIRGPSLQGSCLAAIAGALLLLAPFALAQEAAPPTPPALAEQPAQAVKPGLFEAIGRWFDDGTSTFRTHLRGAKERIDSLGDDAAKTNRELAGKAADVGKGAVDVTKGAVEVTKDAVDAVVKLPTTRVMKGHERCAAAPNGAPDCIAAADALCRKHGFSPGKSMDFTSAEECPVRVHLSGRQSEADCTTVTFISRAMCQ